MTVREVFERAILFANEKKANWINVIRLKELNNCYITNCDDSDVSFTLFLGDASSIELIRMVNRIGINVSAVYFIYADSFKIVDMHTKEEFIINKDGIK